MNATDLSRRGFRRGIHLALGALLLPGGLAAGQAEPPQSLEKMLSLEITTAAKYKQALGDVPASVTVITSEDIAEFGFRTLDDALLTVPGFYVSNDRDYAYVGTRGFGRPGDFNNRILLMLNGHTLNESVYGSAFLGTDFGLDLRIVDRIEIIRGPGSALYGTSALFAVVNVITKRGADLDGGAVSLEAGSYGLWRGGALAGKRLRGGLELTVSGQATDILGPDLYFPEFDSPETNAGLAEGLDWDRNRGLFAGLAYKGFSVQGVLATRSKGVPTASFETIFNDERHRTTDGYGFLEAQYERDLGRDKSLMARGYYHRYDYRGQYPYVDGLNKDSTTDSWIGGEARFRWDLAPNNRLILGTELQDHLRADYIYTFADIRMAYDWPLTVLSLFAQDEWQVSPNLALTVGARYDDYSNAAGHLSPRVAAIFHPVPSATAKLLYGEAFRTPGGYERDYDDPLAGYKPSSGLKPEIIRTFELSYEQRLGKRLYAFASLFRYRMKGLVDWVLDPADGLFQARNVGLVGATGFEIGLNAQLGRGARFLASYSWQDARDLNADAPLTNSPRHLLKGGLSWTVAGTATLSAWAFYESSRLTVTGTSTDPYALVHVTALSRPLFGHVVLSLQVRNLFDARYGYPGGLEHVQPVIFQNGRTAQAAVEYRF